MRKGFLIVTAMMFLMGVSSQIMAHTAGSECNGSTCDANGKEVECPKSGGPTCESDESCSCICKNLGGGEWTSYNECTKKKKADMSALDSALDSITTR